MSLEQLSIVLGVGAVVWPLTLALKFLGTTRLGKASAIMYLGEAVVTGISLTFAWLGYTHMLEDLSGTIQTIMRLTGFATAITTSLILHLVVREIVKNGDKDCDESSNLYSKDEDNNWPQP